jgi:hypothetical protein
VEKIVLPPRLINLSPDGYKNIKAPNGASLFVEKIGLPPRRINLSPDGYKNIKAPNGAS